MLDKISPLPTKAVAPAANDVIKLAVLAVGGQGGGVLSDWIVEVAERSGYVAQSTSVAGVAQRTGATIYYIEMAADTGRLPVFALSPSQGDVDILVAAELMEAGRAIIRGFVTPDRTTLIASSHRIAAVSEKIEPGDGRASSPKVWDAAVAASSRFIAFDMEKIAVDSGTVISSSLFGALAAADVLPFPRESYEETIKASERGVSASLAAFRAAYDRTRGMSAGTGSAAAPLAFPSGSSLPEDGAKRPGGQMSGGADGAHLSATGPQALLSGWQVLATRVAALPEAVRDMTQRGLRKVVDYQDVAYGREYLDRLDRAVNIDAAERGFALSIAAAKHLANAMCYDDMIRVADLKTRSTRDQRVRREVDVKAGSILQVTEYFHPRIEEFCGTMPTALGRYIEGRPRLAAFLDRRINHGRRIRTDSMTGFAMLWLVGGLRRWRRKFLRHEVERLHLERWYELALDQVATGYGLAVEILECRRLIKGYSDTHVRAHSKFDRVLSGLDVLTGRPDAADWLRRLREAALKDEKGDLLDGALKTIRSFASGDTAPAIRN